MWVEPRSQAFTVLSIDTHIHTHPHACRHMHMHTHSYTHACTHTTHTHRDHMHNLQYFSHMHTHMHTIRPSHHHSYSFLQPIRFTWFNSDHAMRLQPTPLVLFSHQPGRVIQKYQTMHTTGVHASTCSFVPSRMTLYTSMAKKDQTTVHPDVMLPEGPSHSIPGCYDPSRRTKPRTVHLDVMCK